MGRSGGKDNGIVFAIKTDLCTQKQLEAADHLFPFQCQMPMVNFPASLHHPMISTTFILTASINSTWKSEPFVLYFEPFVETSRVPKVTVSTYNSDYGSVSLLTGMHYHLATASMILIRVPSDVHCYVYLKRLLRVDKHHEESSIISSVEGSGVLELAIPQSVDVPSIRYSSRCSVGYAVSVYSAKAIVLRRRLFEIPVFFGTLNHGTRAPDDLLSYADDGVFRDMTARGKPILRGTTDQVHDDLPPYDSAVPPRYPLVT